MIFKLVKADSDSILMEFINFEKLEILKESREEKTENEATPTATSVASPPPLLLLTYIVLVRVVSAYVKVRSWVLISLILVSWHWFSSLSVNI